MLFVWGTPHRPSRRVRKIAPYLSPHTFICGFKIEGSAAMESMPTPPKLNTHQEFVGPSRSNALEVIACSYSSVPSVTVENIGDRCKG